MKKNFLLTLIALLSIVSAQAYDFQSGDLYYNITSRTEPYTVEVTYQQKLSSNNYEGLISVTIPATVTYNGTTYSVTSIGDYAFSRCTSLTSVTIPNSVMSIGWSAFFGCTGLTSVTIPNSVTSIGIGAFYDCTSLTSITIPNSVTSIGDYAFSRCTSLTSVTIPENVTSIGMWTFSGCTSLTSVTIPENVTSIGMGTFNGCTSLTSVTIPENVTSIGSGAFEGCTGLKKVNYIGDVRGWLCIDWGGDGSPIEYSRNLYINDVLLTDLVIPDGVTEISSAFAYDTCITSVTIPNSVTSIGNSVFYGCTGLTSVTIPNNVTSIESNAFYGCTGLTSVTIPNNVTSIGSSAFYNVPNIVYNGTATGSPWGARSVNGYVEGYLVYADATQTTLLACSSAATGTITIPNSVTSIGEYAFCSCTGLKSVTIPESVTSIGKRAFYGCTGLTSVVWNAKKCGSWSSYSYSPFFSAGDNITSFTFGNEVESIPAYLCFKMSKLTSITISNSVTSIGKNAFSRCTGLTSVTIPNSVTSIEYGTFDGCTGLTSITIPNSVTSIGDYAFFGCTSLTSVTIPENVTSIRMGTFSGCTGLTSVTIPNSVTSIGERAFYNVPNIVYNGTATGSPWGARSVNGYVEGYLVYADATKTTLLACYTTATGAITIPNSVTSIGKNAFCNCTSLTSITIPNSVTSIGNGAFSGCTSLTSITIPNSVTSIGENAFCNCTGLTSITIPNSVTSIGEDAFYGCEGLTSITIPNSVTSIGDWAFSDCTGLTSITIPNSVTSIGMYAFCGCTGLTSITIPNSVTSIGEGAFSDCTGLKKVNYIGDVRGWLCIDWGGDGSPIEYSRNLYINDVLLTDLVIPDGVTEISSAFAYDTCITSVTIPNSVTSIGNSAFYGCTGLTSITIPNSVTSIEVGAFSGCTGLTSVVWNAKKCGGWSSDYYSPFYSIKNNITSFTFGVDVESIPAYLCYGMSKLTSITIPESVTSIGRSAFDNTAWYNNQPDGVIYINKVLYKYKGTMPQGTSIAIKEGIISISDCAFYNCTGLTSITIPNSVTSIGEYAFCSCTGLKSVTIPESVTSIGKRAFYGCTGLTSVVWNAKKCGSWSSSYYSPFFSAGDNITSFTFGNEVESIPAYLCFKMSKLTSITISNSVTSIGEYAFCRCTGLTSVTIPNNVTSIESNAFDGCTGLTSITIPNSVTSIGDLAFASCTGLTSVTIPNSVTSIGWAAFFGCTGLTSLQVKAQTPPQCSDQSFDDVPKDIPVHVPCGTKEAYQAAYGWSSFTNIIEEHDYAVAVKSSNEEYGTATIVSYTCGNELTIQATANEHYHFTQWNDGNTDNPRTFMVSQDTTLQAEFALNHYMVTTICEISQGIVTGGGTYQYGEQITLQAVPNSGYEFKQWSNGLTYNPYRFTVIEDLTLEAVFVSSAATALEDAPIDTATPQKVFINGQVYILRNGKTYTLTGVKVEDLP